MWTYSLCIHYLKCYVMTSRNSRRVTFLKEKTQFRTCFSILKLCIRYMSNIKSITVFFLIITYDNIYWLKIPIQYIQNETGHSKLIFIWNKWHSQQIVFLFALFTTIAQFTSDTICHRQFNIILKWVLMRYILF